METKAHHILIGAFVLLTLIGGLLFALWVAKVSLDDAYEEYDVVFDEAVSGLSKGAAVNFNGIQVGEVRRLSLDRADPSRVFARIRVDAETPVRTDTTAQLTYTGITGVVIIELIAGKADAPALLPAAGAEFGLIVGKPSAIQTMMTSGADILVRFNEALERVNTILSDENTGRLSQALAHIEAITAEVDGDKAALGAALRSADRAFVDLEALVSQGGLAVARANQMLDQEIAPAAVDLKKTLAALREIAARVDQLLERNGTQIDQLAQQGIPSLTATLEDLQSLAKNLSQIAERLEAAPADYLLQRDRPREYRPK